MKRLTTLAAVVCGLTLFPNPAAADISRGCAGTVFIETEGGGAPLATIDGRGFCKNRLHANECRERARKAIVACVRDLWANRNAARLPASCTVHGGGRPSARLTWLPGTPARLSSFNNRLTWNACCKLRPNANGLAYSVRAGIVGDKGCSAGFPIEGSITQVQCANLRANGFCG